MAPYNNEIKKKISIITAVHNQLAMNKIFYNSLVDQTTLPFELIIVDNNSTDGTREYFKRKADILIENKENFSYPYCQNQGIAAATGDYFAFLNNDLILCKNWGARAIKIMRDKNIDVLSFSTNDSLGDRQAQKKLNRRWKWCKYPIFAILGVNNLSLKLSLKLTYNNLSLFAEKRFEKYKYNIVEGYSGSCFIIKKEAFKKIGLWDESIQAGDFDLFNRVKMRSILHGDIRPVQLAQGIYFHHYQRLTTKNSNTPFADVKKLTTIDKKWKEKTAILRKDIVE